MEFSNRMPRVKRFGTPKNNGKNQVYKNYTTCSIEYDGFKHLTHPEMRELQRYGTLSVNKNDIVDAICNDNAIIISKDNNSVTALVRHSSRYYIAVMDTDLKIIKTFLPDTICNFLEYVQMLMDKEHSVKLQAAA